MAKLTKTKVAGIPEGFKELSFSTNGVILNYVVGPDNGLPLMLIPGQMESWQGYKCVLPDLSKRFQVFVPDLRGHGKSTWTPGYYSYNICGRDLKNFIQEVIQKPALVAGLSSGGVLAIWLGAYAPEDVLAVIAGAVSYTNCLVFGCGGYSATACARNSPNFPDRICKLWSFASLCDCSQAEWFTPVDQKFTAHPRVNLTRRRCASACVRLRRKIFAREVTGRNHRADYAIVVGRQ